ncbi:MAG TPA: SMP-30/gluconolactonase/LRE family protein [Nocardioidaceae bacterium]|nr:SMP-30/gluconolactonase/LRE family protein [Nocardioidaceae bacterium]
MAELTVIPVPGSGAEDVVVDAQGLVYTGTEDGAIFRVTPDGRHIDRVAHTGGRPLGIELLADGRLLVCDARRGVLAVDLGSGDDLGGVAGDDLGGVAGDITVLVDRVDGRPMAFCNNAAVHSNGDVYFSDSSRTYGVDRWRADMVEDTTSGRLLRRSAEGGVDVLLDHLRFANGVALSADESYVAVAETAGRRIARQRLTGAGAGRTDMLVDDLPGYPDNIARGSDGLIWVSIASPCDPLLERLMRAPRPVRQVAWRLPEAVQPKVKRTVHVMALDDDGRTVHDRTFPAQEFHMVTGVREHDGRVWLGSLHEPAVAFFDL